MRDSLVAMLVLGLLSIPLMAQDNPRFEVFGGYQYLHIGGNSNGISTSGEGFNGWNALVTGNVTHHFGIEGNFGGAYDTIQADVQNISFKVYSYAGGPVIFTQSGRIKPFAHALFGGIISAPVGWPRAATPLWRVEALM